ncbi:MAG: transketolase family protein [Kiritimatiellia bacterium]
MKVGETELRTAANAIRVLVADMVEKANSGHPGGAMGQADVAATLWLEYLKVDPGNPLWADRDRLVFSGGHCSPLVYALFHLAGMDGLGLDELKNFRQFGSRTAGHPEREQIRGIDVSTGPLGQGLAMGVGLALAAKMQAKTHRTWILCGDGDMEEGISHEACSFAGTLALGGLVLIYDSNDITIEGRATIAMTDDTAKRFESYGWKVVTCDGHDYASIRAALDAAVAETAKPVLVISHTHIGQGAPSKHDTPGVHGAPLGAEELAATKIALGYDPARSFEVPQAVYGLFAARAAEIAATLPSAGGDGCGAVRPAGESRLSAFFAALPAFDPAKPVATRAACGTVMNALAEVCPELVGGSADLEPSNKTGLKKYGWIAPGDFTGRNIHFGIRELAMAAIVNGMAAYGGLKPFGATFFVFSDYCKPALRLAALMGLDSRFVFSHDSFYVGEDGPTHEPVEQIESLRTMPNVDVYRPADANETGACWAAMLARTEGPSCILTTRQNLPILPAAPEKVVKGAYVLFESGAQDAETVLFIGTGSEVHLCREAAKALAAEGRSVRVVSMPCVERFRRQDAAYRAATIPDAMTKRVLAEAGSKKGLMEFAAVASTTRYLSLDRYGASGPYKVLAAEFGFTVEHTLALARELV